MPSQAQWIHIFGILLGALVVVAGIYDQMQLATALGALVVAVGSIGTYLGSGASAPSSGGAA